MLVGSTSVSGQDSQDVHTGALLRSRESWDIVYPARFIPHGIADKTIIVPRRILAIYSHDTRSFCTVAPLALSRHPPVLSYVDYNYIVLLLLSFLSFISSFLSLLTSHVCVSGFFLLSRPLRGSCSPVSRYTAVPHVPWAPAEAPPYQFRIYVTITGQ